MNNLGCFDTESIGNGIESKSIRADSESSDWSTNCFNTMESSMAGSWLLPTQWDARIKNNMLKNLNNDVFYKVLKVIFGKDIHLC